MIAPFSGADGCKLEAHPIFLMKGVVPMDTVKNSSVTPEQRYKMIAEAAYFRAEKRGFTGGNVANDWLDAEAEIDRILAQRSDAHQEGASTKKAFQKRLEEQVKEWDAKFEKLQAKAKKAKAEIRADIEKQIAVLAEKRASANTKIKELRHRSEDTWEDLRTGTEKRWKEMHDALDRLVSRFK